MTSSDSPAPMHDPRTSNTMATVPVYLGVDEAERRQIGAFLKREDTSDVTHIELAGLLHSYADTLANTPEGTQVPAVSIVLVRP